MGAPEMLLDRKKDITVLKEVQKTLAVLLKWPFCQNECAKLQIYFDMCKKKCTFAADFIKFEKFT